MSHIRNIGDFTDDVDNIWFYPVYQDRTSMFVFFVDEFAKITHLAETNSLEAINRIKQLTDLISESRVITEHEKAVLLNLSEPVQIHCVLKWQKCSWVQTFIDISKSTKGEREKKKSAAVVYFLLSDDEKLVKIGYSKNVVTRTRSLEMSSPVKLRLIKEIPGGSEKEAELHRRFAHLRQHGEWFLYTPELRKFIKSL